MPFYIVGSMKCENHLHLLVRYFRNLKERQVKMSIFYIVYTIYYYLSYHMGHRTYYLIVVLYVKEDTDIAPTSCRCDSQGKNAVVLHSGHVRRRAK